MAYEHRLGGPFSYVDGLATPPVGQQVQCQVGGFR